MRCVSSSFGEYDEAGQGIYKLIQLELSFCFGRPCALPPPWRLTWRRTATVALCCPTFWHLTPSRSTRPSRLTPLVAASWKPARLRIRHPPKRAFATTATAICILALACRYESLWTSGFVMVVPWISSHVASPSFCCPSPAADPCANFCAWRLRRLCGQIRQGTPGALQRGGHQGHPREARRCLYRGVRFSEKEKKKRS